MKHVQRQMSPEQVRPRERNYGVISEQNTDTQPKVSTASILRTKTNFFAICSEAIMSLDAMRDSLKARSKQESPK